MYNFVSGLQKLKPSRTYFCKFCFTVKLPRNNCSDLGHMFSTDINADHRKKRFKKCWDKR